MKYEKSTTLPIKCHLLLLFFISVTIKDLNVVALRNGYRIFLKHVCTFVIRQYINTICSGGDLGSCKAALPTAGERGWRAKYQKYAAYLKSWRPSSQRRWVQLVVSYCSNIPSTWQRHQVLSNLPVFCSAKVLYTVCVCMCVDLQCFPTNTVNMHVCRSRDGLGRSRLLRRNRRRVFLESLVGDVRNAVMEGDGEMERQERSASSQTSMMLMDGTEGWNCSRQTKTAIHILFCFPAMIKNSRFSKWKHRSCDSNRVLWWMRIQEYSSIFKILLILISLKNKFRY